MWLQCLVFGERWLARFPIRGCHGVLSLCDRGSTGTAQRWEGWLQQISRSIDIRGDYLIDVALGRVIQLISRLLIAIASSIVLNDTPWTLPLAFRPLHASVSCIAFCRNPTLDRLRHCACTLHTWAPFPLSIPLCSDRGAGITCPAVLLGKPQLIRHRHPLHKRTIAHVQQ